MKFTQEEQLIAKQGSYFFYLLILPIFVVIAALINPYYLSETALLAKEINFYSTHFFGFSMAQLSLLVSRIGMIGVALTLFFICKKENPLMVSFVTVLMLISSVFVLGKFSADLIYLPLLADLYLNSPPDLQKLLYVKGGINIDFGLLGFGLPLFWCFGIAYFSKNCLPFLSRIVLSLMGVSYFLISVMTVCQLFHHPLMKANMLLITILFAVFGIYSGRHLYLESNR